MNFVFFFFYTHQNIMTRICLCTKMNKCEKNEFLIGLKAQNTNLFLETRDQGRDAL